MTKATRLPGLLASLGACVGMSASASANTFFPCYTESEIGSAQIHEMRIALMVDALKCRDVVPASARSFEQLMVQRDGDFQQHAGKLEAQLVERYGARQGRIAFADYETMLGNFHAKGRYTVQTCRNLDAFMRLAERAANTDLRALSEVMPRSAIRACPAGSFDADEMVPVVEPLVAVEQVREAVVAHAHSEPVMTAGSEDEHDLTPLAERVAPMTPLAKVDPSTVSPAPAAARSDRLESAIKALDSAAAALRELQSEAPAG